MPYTTPELLALHKQFVADNQKQIQAQTLSGDSGILYSTSYFLHGMLSAVEGTGDEDLLQQTITYLNNTINASVETTRNGRSYRVWGQKNKEGKLVLDAEGRPQQLSSFQSVAPIARAAAVINAREEWKKTYATDAQRFIGFVDQSVVRFWFDKEIGEYKVDQPWPRAAGPIPWLPKALGGWGTYAVWTGFPAWTGILATYLYQASTDLDRKIVYLDIATRVASAFRAKLKPLGAGWIWEQGKVPIRGYDKRNTSGTPDTSHSNHEPMMMTAMYEAGLPEFTLTDVERMARTLTDTLWNKDMNNPAFANYIDGGNQPYGAATKPYSNGLIYAGWALLGRYSLQARAVLERTFDVIMENDPNSRLLGRQNYTPYGRVALSGHLLRNRLPVGVSTALVL